MAGVAAKGIETGRIDGTAGRQRRCPSNVASALLPGCPAHRRPGEDAQRSTARGMSFHPLRRPAAPRPALPAGRSCTRPQATRRAMSGQAILCAVLWAALAGCAAPSPGLGPDAARVPVDVTAAPWRSLGLVATAVGGRCTGVLVSPNTVLTAAHCLVDPRTNRAVAPRAVQFTLASPPGAVSPGGTPRQARATEALIGPGFSVAPGPRPDPSAPPDSDWAVLLLDTPLGAPGQVMSLEAGLLPPGTPLVFGGYQSDREGQMVADLNCAVSGYARDPAGRVMLHHSCAATTGASGGPLLARRPDGGWIVAGIGSLAEGGVTGGWAVPTASIARVVLSAHR